MTKKELISEVQEKSGGELTKKQVDEIVDAVFNSVSSAIKEGRFAYPGFGTFSVKTRASRKGRNPRSGVEIDIPASKSVSFKPSPEMKKSLS